MILPKDTGPKACQNKRVTQLNGSVPSLSWPSCHAQAVKALSFPVPFHLQNGKPALSPYPLKHTVPRIWEPEQDL